MTNVKKKKDLMEELNIYKQLAKDYKLIIDATYDTISIADSDGVFISVQNCLEFLGVPESEVVGRSYHEVEEQGVVKETMVGRVFRSKKKEVMSYSVPRVGRTFMLTGIPTFIKGELNKVFVVSVDITEHENLKKRLEETMALLGWYQTEILKIQGMEKKYIYGNSLAMKKVMQLVSSISQVDATVLLTGETGSGKNMIARIISEVGPRSRKPFIYINCGAIPENLLESEFFGYVGGAFTGANKQGKKGYFEIASGGTMFLDEIGELPLQLQVKFLHALERNEILPIGSTQAIPIDTRIIAATNKELYIMVKNGKFREDLYYRLNVLSIHIPSLRERKDDIPVLVNHFLNKYNRKYFKERSISTTGYFVLINYSWPGNIRELENALERLVITSETNVITDEQIMEAIYPIHEKIDYASYDMLSLKEATERLETLMILKAYNKHKSTRKIAEALKIDQSTVVKRLKKLRADIPLVDFTVE